MTIFLKSKESACFKNSKGKALGFVLDPENTGKTVGLSTSSKNNRTVL